MNLEEILADEKTFADSIEFELGGRKVNLGDLRGLSRKQRTDLADRMADTERKRAEVLQLAEQAANLKNSLDAQLAEAGKRAAPTDDFDSDPFWGPVKKQFAPLTEINKKLEAKVTSLENAANQMAKIWAEDRWRSQFDRSKERLKGDKFKDMTYEKVRDYAGTNKILDSYGLPSVEKAILELTKEDEIQTKVDEAFQRGLREGNVKGRMGVQPKPTSASGGAKLPENSMVAKKGLEGLGDDVAEDPEMMEMLSKLGAMSPEDLVQ